LTATSAKVGGLTATQKLQAFVLLEKKGVFFCLTFPFFNLIYLTLSFALWITSMLSRTKVGGLIATERPPSLPFEVGLLQIPLCSILSH
jgi:hypothetical protein